MARRAWVITTAGMLVLGSWACGDGDSPAPSLAPSSSCGDGVRQVSEVCDGTDVNGQSCTSLGLEPGTLGCSSDCRNLDVRDCGKPQDCGNGRVDATTERCDGTDLAGATCASQGYERGTLSCLPNCAGFDTTSCEAAAHCGDNIKNQPNESCDGTDLGGFNCLDQGFTGGQLRCRLDCRGFDASGCQRSAVCGDNLKSGADEVCDGTDLGGLTCTSLGLTAGALRCAADCRSLDTSGCGGGSCVPNCQGRVCGPDPVCQQSCGTCNRGRCNASGQCTVQEGGPPVIVVLDTNTDIMEEEDTLVFSAVVTDPDGIDDVIGGTLRDPQGGTYGSFMTSASEGSYSLTLRWDEIRLVRGFVAPVTGTSRTFLAEFYDQAGHRQQATVDVVLRCGGGNRAACADGICTDLDTDQKNCGACGHVSLGTCRDGLPKCWGPRSQYDILDAGVILCSFGQTKQCGADGTLRELNTCAEACMPERDFYIWDCDDDCDGPQWRLLPYGTTRCGKDLNGYGWMVKTCKGTEGWFGVEDCGNQSCQVVDNAAQCIR